MTHDKQVCKHGTIVTQCRCPGPKQTVIVRCPIWCKEREDQ